MSDLISNQGQTLASQGNNQDDEPTILQPFHPDDAWPSVEDQFELVQRDEARQPRVSTPLTSNESTTAANLLMCRSRRNTS